MKNIICEIDKCVGCGGGFEYFSMRDEIGPFTFERAMRAARSLVGQSAINCVNVYVPNKKTVNGWEYIGRARPSGTRGMHLFPADDHDRAAMVIGEGDAALALNNRFYNA